MPRPYTLCVHSNPNKLSPELWQKWVLEEHIRDMVWFNVAKNAAFYRSSSEVFTSGSPPIDGSETMPFLAVYQTDRGDISSGTGGSEKVRLTSGMWKAEGCEGLMVFDVADLIMADGSLVEVLGSYEYNESMVVPNQPIQPCNPITEC
jgi:hypothetical protein